MNGNQKRQQRRAKGRKSRLKMKPAERIVDAKAWLKKQILSVGLPDKLIEEYRKRFHVNEDTAFWELAEIGYYDEVQVERYERDGIEWEYKVEGYDGEMKVVPQGTPDWELFYTLFIFADIFVDLLQS